MRNGRSLAVEMSEKTSETRRDDIGNKSQNDVNQKILKRNKESEGVDVINYSNARGPSKLTPISAV